MCIFSSKASFGLESLTSFGWLFCLVSTLSILCMCSSSFQGWKPGLGTCIWSAGTLHLEPSHWGSFIIEAFVSFFSPMRWGELIGLFGWLVCLTCCPSPIYNLGIRELVPLSDLGTLTCVSLVEHPHSECSTVLVKPFKCFFGTQTFQIQCFKFVGEGYPTCIF